MSKYGYNVVLVTHPEDRKQRLYLFAAPYLARLKKGELVVTDTFMGPRLAQCASDSVVIFPQRELGLLATACKADLPLRRVLAQTAPLRYDEQYDAPEQEDA